jgi:hypothetical protein
MDESRETFELPIYEKPTSPPIELKALPAGLRYAFLHGDMETPVIINDMVTNKETRKL